VQTEVERGGRERLGRVWECGVNGPAGPYVCVFGFVLFFVGNLYRFVKYN